MATLLEIITENNDKKIQSIDNMNKSLKKYKAQFILDLLTRIRQADPLILQDDEERKEKIDSLMFDYQLYLDDKDD